MSCSTQLRTRARSSRRRARRIARASQRVDVSARGDEIRVVLEAHAAARGRVSAAGMRRVRLRCAAQRSTARRTDAFARDKGVLHVALARGVHRIELVYAATADKVALRFPLRPMRIEFAGDGWQASGIGDSHLLTETLSLARSHAAGASEAAASAQQFAPFVRVERDITLGLDWVVSTVVRRLAPNEGGFTVSVPTLGGEHVSTAGIKHRRRQRHRGDSRRRADGAMEQHARQGRHADADGTRADRSRRSLARDREPDLARRSERRAGVGRRRAQDKSDYRRFEFHPLPGETLTLKHHAAARGRRRDARDRSREPRARARDSARPTPCSMLTMRASQGGEQVITLPADAEVMHVVAQRPKC